MTVRESEWTDAEREYLLTSRRDERRGLHGHLLSESTSPAANPANSDGAYFYVAEAPIVDWAEYARAKAYEKFRAAQADGESMAGYVFPVRRVERRPPPT